MTCYFEKSTGTLIGEVEEYHGIVEKDFVEIEIHNGMIPEEVEGVAVTAIGDDAFARGSVHGKLVIPGSVKRIGDRAFYNRIALQFVDLSEGLEEIGVSAFEETGIKNMKFPKSLRVIEPKAFYRCNNLVHISIENGLEEIGLYAFASVNVLNVTIPQSVKCIGPGALNRPTNIRKKLQVRYVGTTKEWEQLSIAKELREENVICLGDQLNTFIEHVPDPISEEEKKLYEMGYNKEYLEARLADTFLMYQEKYRNDDMDEKQIRCKVYRDFLDSM